MSISFLVSLLAGCGEVTAAGAEETQACAKKKCVGKDCPPPGQKHESDAGSTCVAKDDGGAPSADVSPPASGGTAPMEVAEFSCTVCRRAENCCKAEGLADCGYTAACANATNAQQMQFYLVLCRAVLGASTDGAKTRPDVCAF